MSLVPCKKSLQNEQVTLEKIFLDRLPSLGIREVFSRQLWKKTVTSPRVIRLQRIGMTRPREGAIIILAPAAREKLVALADPLRREIFARLIPGEAALLIFAECRTLPVFIRKELAHHRLPAAISSLHENLLESRIKAILQEKIKRTVTVHGVALDHQGRGILIRGVSGIGKTTAAMEVMSDGFCWIADDRVVIKKDRRGKLFLSGHPAIQKYVDTGPSGILAVDCLWRASQIRNKAELSFVIDVVRSSDGDSVCRCMKTEILDTRVPLVQIGICQTGYFNKNLLTKALQKWTEVG